MFGRLAPLVPPEALIDDGPPDYRIFRENGEEFLRLYIDLAGLKPDEAILDVGCGIGRKTIYLTEYLSDRARYEGIDIKKSDIDWCTRTIARKRSNFHFQQIDVYNQHFNPVGIERASEYRFPFPDDSFDFVTLGSVFTHMLTNDVENYLQQVTRVLKPGGRCLISWFLLNQASENLVRSGKSTLDLTAEIDAVCRSISHQVPEQAIGFDERFVLDLYARCGLAIRAPVNYGSWCGRIATYRAQVKREPSKYLSYQDLILAVPGAITTGE
jgi:SAM-dependent methyltransferase